jgi:hypothetical protein
MAGIYAILSPNIRLERELAIPSHPERDCVTSVECGLPMRRFVAPCKRAY